MDKDSRAEEPQGFSETADIVRHIRKLHVPLALDTYYKLMIGAKDEKVRKSAADAIMEIEGAKGNKSAAVGGVNFTIEGDFLKLALSAMGKIAAPHEVPLIEKENVIVGEAEVVMDAVKETAPSIPKLPSPSLDFMDQIMERGAKSD